MTDETPPTPRRRHRPAASTPKPDDPVGVMAGTPGGAAAGDEAPPERGTGAAAAEGAPGHEDAPDDAAAGEAFAAAEASAAAEATAAFQAPDADAGVGPVAQGAVLRLTRGGLAEATAGRVEVKLGGIGRLDAEEVSVQWGGVGLARADRLNVELGSVGAALAGEATVTQGIASNVVARQVTLGQSFVRTLVAQHVTVNRPTGVLVMIAQNVTGEVRPMLDWRGALVAGLAFGLVTAAWQAARGGGKAADTAARHGRRGRRTR